MLSAVFMFVNGGLAYDQYLSITENQSIVDSMKEVWGKPIGRVEAMELIFGTDHKFWLLPTKPALKVNYFERLYTWDLIEKFESGQPLPEGTFDELNYEEIIETSDDSTIKNPETHRLREEYEGVERRMGKKEK